MEMVTYRACVLKSKFYSVRSLINTHSFHVDLTLITDNVNMRYVSENTEQLVDMRIFVIFFFLGGRIPGKKTWGFEPQTSQFPSVYILPHRVPFGTRMHYKDTWQDAIQEWPCGQTEASDFVRTRHAGVRM